MALSVELQNLSKTFERQDGSGPVTVFEGIDLAVAPGGFVSIVGPSGCGKTTLLRIIAGLEQAGSGRILFDGKPAKDRSGRVGLVFQEYALFPWRTTVDNIAMGLEFAGVPEKERIAQAMAFVEAFGLTGFEHQFPKALSGGMKQRVAIARTLITKPGAVLMDEPFGSLDSQTRNEMQTFLMEVWQRQKTTVLFITHNVDEAVFLSDRILVMSRRPARILADFNLENDRPRDRTGRSANRLRKEILGLLATGR